MTQITREMLVDVLDTKLEEKLKPIYDSIGEVKASLKFLSDKYDSVDKRVGELEIKCQTVVQENTFLRAEVLRLSRSLDDVSNEIDNMNQYGRRDCCEISGLPVEHGEDTNKLVINLGSQMGLNLTESDISVSHRLPNNNSYSSRLKQGKVNPVSQIPKLIVKFVRRDTKELFYKSRKHLKGITTKDLGLSRLAENKIYISESLSPRNREIFKACLKFKERNYFKYIWTQQGRIYLRKNSDTPTRIITCQDDLNNLQPS